VSIASSSRIGSATRIVLAQLQGSSTRPAPDATARNVKTGGIMYISARDIQVNNVLCDGTTVTSVTYPVSGDRVEVFTNDGNRIIWFGDSQVEVR
jgi:hypothetical protein